MTSRAFTSKRSYFQNRWSNRAQFSLYLSGALIHSLLAVFGMALGLEKCCNQDHTCRNNALVYCSARQCNEATVSHCRLQADAGGQKVKDNLMFFRIQYLLHDTNVGPNIRIRIRNRVAFVYIYRLYLH